MARSKANKDRSSVSNGIKKSQYVRTMMNESFQHTKDRATYHT